MLIQC